MTSYSQEQKHNKNIDKDNTLMVNSKQGSLRGFLNRDFEFFHLQDNKSLEFEYHYHDFNKIIIFISGDVTYFIEGRAYRLRPWDILLVSNKEIHRPVIYSKNIYERIIIWVNPAFIEKHNTKDCNLLSCFELAMNKKHNLMRLNPELLKMMKQTLIQLEDACKSTEFGGRILKNSLFLQLVVHLNRLYIGYDNMENPKDIDGTEDIEYDENIEAIIKYINMNLSNNLSIDTISSEFFSNKYHLMHKFKDQTGYTIHSYILQKRLILANSLIKKGLPLGEVSLQCGFDDYSSFFRAYRKMFGVSPKKHFKLLHDLKKSYDSEVHFK